MSLLSLSGIPLIKSRWIQCDLCSKWRKICNEKEFPETFVCNSDGQDAPYNVYDADVEEGLPKLFEAGQDNLDDEVIKIECGMLVQLRY